MPRFSEPKGSSTRRNRTGLFSVPRNLARTVVSIGIGLLLLPMGSISEEAKARSPGTLDRPNVLLILVDDLGYGELGCYGQAKIRTPVLDRLAAEGMRFTRHYSGSPVCAPTRCVLLTGKHSGRAYVRDNKEMGGWGPDEPEGQLSLRSQEITLAEVLKANGYATGFVGKWGLGGPESDGHPNRQGFDFFYGYLCQRVAHNYYPTHLWRNQEKVLLSGNEYFPAHQKIEAPPAEAKDYGSYSGETFAPDSMIEEALAFVSEPRERPFFLEFATPVPHVALQVPDDSTDEYRDSFPETPYLGQKGYLPHPSPRAAYAAMITRMDRDLGRLLDRLDELELAEKTVVLFTSDNGPTYAGGVDYDFFQSAGSLRGLKGSVYEGGIRVPLLVRWKGRVESGSVSDVVSAHWDLFPTVTELCGISLSEEIRLDGRSLAGVLTGSRPSAEPRDWADRVLYWELNRKQAVLAGRFKLVRIADKKGRIRQELYDLTADPSEAENLADQRPDKVAELVGLASRERTKSEEFPSPFDESGTGRDSTLKTDSKD